MRTVIDLTRRDPGCAGHPLMRLNRLLKEIKEAVEVVIIFNSEELPIDALLIILKRHGLKMKDKRCEENGICTAICHR